MPSIVRNILAVIAGLVLGGIVNMAIVMINPMLIPPPAGVDMTTVEGLKASMHLLETKHFIGPFLAHAIGTFAGALTAWLIALNRKSLMAYIVAAFFLIGGIAAASMIPAPTWFIVLDLVVAYLPMAWLAGMVGAMLTGGRSAAATA